MFIFPLCGVRDELVQVSTLVYTTRTCTCAVTLGKEGTMHKYAQPDLLCKPCDRIYRDATTGAYRRHLVVLPPSSRHGRLPGRTLFHFTYCAASSILYTR